MVCKGGILAIIFFKWYNPDNRFRKYTIQKAQDFINDRKS